MRDIAILLILFGLVAICFYRPWLGVLGLTVIGYLNPHKYGSELIANLPAYQIMFVAVSLSTVRAFIVDRKSIQQIPTDWRLVALALLWLTFLITTLYAIETATSWPRFIEVSKSLAPLLFTLLLIDSREKLFYLIITIASCFGLLILKGGYWALMTGFSDRVYGPPGSHFYDNNLFVVAVIMNIPLLFLWLAEANDRRLRYLLISIAFLSVISALSSWSRGGLLCLCVTLLLLVWHSKRKYLATPLLLIGVLLTFELMPQDWISRMESLLDYEAEQSASRRLETWGIGLDYALAHPWLGAGFDGWRYVTSSQTGLDWHSSYIEIMAEHGLIAFGLWLSLLFGSIVSLSRLAHLGYLRGLSWVCQYGYMLRASLVAYAVGALFLGLAYWDILYHLIIISALFSKFTRDEIHKLAEKKNKTRVHDSRRDSVSG